jgi:hypothetical protein
MEEITITVLIKNNKFLGLLIPNTSFPNSVWWDKEISVTVPKADWDAEKITISTIRNYIQPGNYSYN